MIEFKKILGPIARTYIMHPFNRLKVFLKSLVGLVKQVDECRYLKHNDFKPGSQNCDFCERYYNLPPQKKIKNGIVCIFDGRLYHGGLTDRMRGILSTYEEARKQGIPFYIKWTSPFNLEEYLVPSTFNWHIDSSNISYSLEQVFPLIIEDVPKIESRMRLKAALKNRKKQIHIYSNGDDARGRYKQLYDEVFKPSESVKAEVERHLKVLGNNYYAFTLRFMELLGDFVDWNKDRLSPNEISDFISKVDNELKKLISNLPDDCRILITSDSRRYLEHVVSLDNRIYVVPGDVKNIDQVKTSHPDAWLKTFVDQQLLMRAQCVWLIRTGAMFRSGFPRFAAEIGGTKYIDHKF